MIERELKDENDVQQAIQIEGPKHNVQLMRNNSGAFKDERSGRWIFFGLGNISKKHSEQIKSSDLVGFTRVLITQDMVGKSIAVFTAVEVKEPGWSFKPSDKRAIAQNRFLTWVAANGGFAGFADSVAAFRKIIGR